jgi:hypothetical protein
VLEAGVVDEDVHFEVEGVQSLRSGQVDHPGLSVEVGGDLSRAPSVPVGDNDGGTELA